MAERWLWPDSVVVRIIDGDTFVAEVTRDLGFHGSVTFRQKMRLNRIDAAAIKTPAGLAASGAFGALVLDQHVHIETVGPYKYGDEWMAEITLPAGENVSDLLVGMGKAVFWDGRGPRPGG